jgi:ABC-type Fe3+ transport system substrate-binding protein
MISAVRSPLWCCCPLPLAFLLLAGVLGCSGRGAEPLRLTMMSPHRDEIREEVGQAFPVWFRHRVETRLTTSRAAVQTWLDADTPEHRNAVELGLRDLLEDWRDDELSGVRTALRGWQDQSNPANGQNLLAALGEAEGQLPPVEVIWLDIGGGTSQIARYIAARFEASRQAARDGIDIDLLFGGGTDIYLRFSRDGYLEPVKMPADLLARIPRDLNGVPLYDGEGRWYGPMLSSFGILCNREVLRRLGEPEPTRWADLGRPGLQGWVTAGDPRLTGSVHMVYEIILQGHGWERGIPLLLRLGANAHGFIRDSGTLTRTVNSGETAAGGNLDANALSAVGREPELMAFHLPAGETIVNPDAIAVLKGAPRKELARAFVEFTLSDAGQLLFLLRPGQPRGPRRYPLCRLSVVEELYRRYPPEERSVGDANPFLLSTTIPYDSKVGTQRWDALNDLLGAVVVDAHPELTEAWRAVLKSPLSEENRARLEGDLFRPPCTEAELKEHARRINEESPRVRTETVNRWGEEARQRYREVARLAQREPNP